MNKLWYFFVVGLLAITTPSSRADVLPANASFETPSVGGDFKYNPTAGSPDNASWTFQGESGIAATATSLTFGGPAAPDGTQVAFLQDIAGFSGSISQTVSGFTAGSYTLSFFAAFRSNGGVSNPFMVSVDSNQLIFGGSNIVTPPSNTSFTLFTSDPFTLSAGSHTLSFVGPAPTPGVNNVSYIDEVSFNGPQESPEPSSLALACCGLAGMAGYFWRQRRNGTSAVECPGPEGCGC